MNDGYQPVAKVSEIKPGERKIVTVKDKEVGIFNVDGRFHVFLNQCPHMGAPICKGLLIKEIQTESPWTFTIKEKSVLRCPWHRWEFSIDSGNSIFDESIRTKKYKTKILDNTIYCKI